MSDDTDERQRRSVLKATGATLAGLVGGPGVASARPGRGRGVGGDDRPGRTGERGPPDHAGRQGPPEHANAPDWVEARNEQLELTVSRDEWNQRSHGGITEIPDDARPIPYSAMRDAVDDFNEAIRNDDMRIERHSGHTHITIESDIAPIDEGDE